MLGSTLVRALPSLCHAQVWGTVREIPDELRHLEDRLVLGVSADNMESVDRALQKTMPDVVINCVGVIKQLKAGKSAIPCVQINALFPHLLHELCQRHGARMIHVSTDCVFSGRKGMYAESDIPDPPDVYGQSKLLGEVVGDNALTIRTSIIGHELGGRHLSLIDWFLASSGTVKGFRKALYSGMPTISLGRLFAKIIDEHPTLSGLYQASSDPINKYDLLCLVQEIYRKTDVQIQPDDAFVIDRTLDSSVLRRTIGWAPPSWPDLVRDMHQYQLEWMKK